MPCTGRRLPVPADGPWQRISKSSRPGPGAEIQYQVIVGPARPHGGYYLSTEGPSTRVRFALNCEPKGFLVRVTNPFRRRMKAEVGQLERLKSILEDMPATE